MNRRDECSWRPRLFSVLIVLLACSPLSGPALSFDGGDNVQLDPEGEFRARLGPRPVGAMFIGSVSENDSGGVSTLASESPDVLTIEDRGEGEFLFHAFAVGDARVRFQNDCGNIGGGCEASFAIQIVDADGAGWDSPFVLVRGASATRELYLTYEDERLESTRAFTSRDGEVDADANTITFATDVDVVRQSLRIDTLGGTTLPLEIPLVGAGELEDLYLSCRTGSCFVDLGLVDGAPIIGAPVQWTYDGMPLDVPEGSDALRATYEGGGSDSCEICATIEAAGLTDCTVVRCGPVSVDL